MLSLELQRNSICQLLQGCCPWQRFSQQLKAKGCCALTQGKLTAQSSRAQTGAAHFYVQQSICHWEAWRTLQQHPGFTNLLIRQSQQAQCKKKKRIKLGETSAEHLYQVVNMCTCKDMSLLKAIQIPNPTKTDNRRVYQRNKCCCIHYTNFRLICYFPRGTLESWRPKCNQYPFTSLCTSASVERLIINAFILADNNLNYFSFSFHPSLQYMKIFVWHLQNTAINNKAVLGLASLRE